MNLRLVAPAAGPAAPLAELADHLRLGASFSDGEAAGLENDPSIPRYLEAATSKIEHMLSAALIRQSYELTAPVWRGGALVLPRRPVLAVAEVAVRGADDAWEPWPQEYWRLDLASQPPRLCARKGPPKGETRILFEAGYGDDWNAVPSDIRHAVLMLAAHYYERRSAFDEARLAPVPMGVAELLQPHRMFRI